jgi:hypothetical protein
LIVNPSSEIQIQEVKLKDTDDYPSTIEMIGDLPKIQRNTAEDIKFNVTCAEDKEPHPLTHTLEIECPDGISGFGYNQGKRWETKAVGLDAQYVCIAVWEPEMKTPEPGIGQTTPENGLIGTPTDGEIKIAFDIPTDTKSVEDAITIYPPIDFVSIWSEGNTILTLKPLEALEYNTTHTVVIGIGAMSALGFHLKERYKFSFTTEEKPDTEPPSIISTVPYSGETNVAIGTEIAVIFSEPMDKDAVESAFHIYPSVEGELIWSNNTLTFFLADSLEYGVSYMVIIDAGARDLAGNNLEQSYSWEFTTKEAQE